MPAADRNEERAEHELEQLLNAVIPLAQRMLARHGQFYPFAAAVKQDGKLTFIPNSRELRQKPPQSLADNLREQLIMGASNGEYRATGLCQDVRVNLSSEMGRSEAVLISVEHLNGRAMDIFLPYAADHEGEITYGEVFASQADPVVFLQQYDD